MEKNLLEIIKKGEGLYTEFKLAKNSLPKSLFETVCSFLNRAGGYIFLGIDDNGKIIGVDKDKISVLKSDFANLCNNSQKIFPSVYLSLKELCIEDKIVLYLYVPESSKVHSSGNKFFDRNEDGDYDVTNNSEMRSKLFLQKANEYYENEIYPYVTINDLRTDLIDRARKMACNKVRNHPWEKMTDLELLKSALLYGKDYKTGKEGVNLAGILLFGKDEVIQSILPYHRVDALLRIKDVERYDDRDDIRTNLIESLDRMVDFIAKHLPDPFYLENNQRISVRDIIAREVCANVLIHRDYSNPFVSKLIITKDFITTENASRFRRSGYLDIKNFSPYPKNPILCRFFSEIGLADELGSGVLKIAKYSNIYNNGKRNPIFKEGDIFETKIPIYTFIIDNSITDINDNESKYKYEQAIKNYCKYPRTSREIQDYIGIKNQSYFNKSILNPLLKAGIIQMTIPNKPKSSNQRYVIKE